MSKTNHGNHAYRQLAKRRLAQAKANGEPCWICGRPIDYDLPPRTRWSPVADHLDPPSLGHPLAPTLNRLAPAHMACNSSRGNGTKPMKMRLPRRRRTRPPSAW